MYSLLEVKNKICEDFHVSLNALDGTNIKTNKC